MFSGFCLCTASLVQEWDEVDDGTMEGSLGYSNILESPPAAYFQLQARLLARRPQSPADF